MWFPWDLELKQEFGLSTFRLSGTYLYLTVLKAWVNVLCLTRSRAASVNGKEKDSWYRTSPRNVTLSCLHFVLKEQARKDQQRWPQRQSLVFESSSCQEERKVTYPRSTQTQTQSTFLPDILQPLFTRKTFPCSAANTHIQRQQDESQECILSRHARTTANSLLHTRHRNTQEFTKYCHNKKAPQTDSKVHVPPELCPTTHYRYQHTTLPTDIPLCGH